ncbi:MULTISPECIES: hypothetical protein [unclassified Sinorhizobium]|uniref:hypothetical protein n=1 Tax=unclassified Sinorhizobium TaxID=2613772 RepID=UPI00352492E6
MAERHVRDGERIVRRQREIVDQLFEHGLPVDLAAELLMEFELTLEDHRLHLARIIESSRADSSSDQRA